MVSWIKDFRVLVIATIVTLMASLVVLPHVPQMVFGQEEEQSNSTELHEDYVSGYFFQRGFNITTFEYTTTGEHLVIIAERLN
jgi:hypothetical protein